MTTASELTAQFIGRDDDFWDIAYDPELGGQVFRNSGISCCCCTGFALEIRRKLGAARVGVFGFSLEDNPTSFIAQQAGGHDFAVVDGWFIVDPWLLEVAGIGDCAVFDLGASDVREIERLYGAREKWKQISVEK